ncbi:hypothetical protein CR513_30543, partial [Mucuna pruriens]
MTYMTLFPLLLQSNLIEISPLNLVEPSHPKSYDPNAKYLINGRWLGFKKNEPNVNNNPISIHGGQSINIMSHKYLKQEPDGTLNLGKAIATPLKLANSKEDSRSSFVQIATIGQVGDLLPKLLIIRYNLIDQLKAPLIIQVPAKSYSPTDIALMEPGESDLTKEVTNITKTRGVMRSRRIYAPKILRKKIQAPEAKDRVIGNMKDTNKARF